MPIKRRQDPAPFSLLGRSSKKKRLEASSLPNSARLEIDNNKISTSDTSEKDVESGIWL